MRKPGKTGFSLLEIAIGLLVFALVGLVFFLSVRSGLKETSVSAYHFSGLMLADKIFEDIIQEFSLNPHGHDSLGINQGNAVPEKIVDGGSVFFFTLEDSAAPWGKIEQVTDGPITREKQPLYNQVKDFKVALKTEQGGFSSFSSEGSNLRLVDLTLQWQGKEKGKIEKSLYVFAPTQAKAFADPAENIDYKALGLEQAVQDLLPITADFSRPLSEIIAGLSGNERIVFEIGSTIVLLENFMKSDFLSKQLFECSKQRAILSRHPSKEQEFEARKKLAVFSFDVARAAFHVIAIASKHLQKITTDPGYSAAIANISLHRINVCYLNFKLILQYFTDCLIEARYQYQKLLEARIADLTNAKERNEIIIRLFDMYRILSFTPGHPSGQREYNSFVARVLSMSKGRDQFMNRYALQENSICRSTAQLLNKFPNIQPVHDILATKVTQIVGFISSQTP